MRSVSGSCTEDPRMCSARVSAADSDVESLSTHGKVFWFSASEMSIYRRVCQRHTEREVDVLSASYNENRLSALPRAKRFDKWVTRAILVRNNHFDFTFWPF